MTAVAKRIIESNEFIYFQRQQPILTGSEEQIYIGGSTRLLGLFHVGFIYTRQWRPKDLPKPCVDYPLFYASSDRQWCAVHGKRGGPGHNVVQRIGSGQRRK